MQSNAGVDAMFHRSLAISIMIPSQNDPEEDDTEEEEGEDAGYDSDDMDEIANDLPFDPVSLNLLVHPVLIFGTDGSSHGQFQHTDTDNSNTRTRKISTLNFHLYHLTYIVISLTYTYARCYFNLHCYFHLHCYLT